MLLCNFIHFFNKNRLSLLPRLYCGDFNKMFSFNYILFALYTTFSQKEKNLFAEIRVISTTLTI